MLSECGHVSSLITLSIEALANKAPDVSFIHDFPGPVKSNIARGGQDAAFVVLNAVFKVIGPFTYVPTEESGERHLFLVTSTTYPVGKGGDTAPGVPLADGVTVARGINGKDGSGVYSIDESCESAGLKTEELLAKFRKGGLVEKVWDHTEEYERITSLVAAQIKRPIFCMS